MYPFQYLRAASVAEAIAASSGQTDTRYMAGGTTLYDLMKLNVEAPRRVIDINEIEELSARSLDGSELVFGALARMSDIAADPVIVRDYPVLSEALWKAASGQLRNMASLGGNLLQRTRCAYLRYGEPYSCNKRQPESGCSAIDGLDRTHALLGTSEHCIATYPGDLAVALLALDARLDLLGPEGERNIALAELHREPGSSPQIEHSLRPGELILRIRVPRASVGKASTYHKIRDRESYAFALASAAVALEMRDGLVVDARIALGGIATRPWRATTAEQSLIGRRLNHASARLAGEIALQPARSGQHNSFRIELGARTVADALLIASERG